MKKILFIIILFSLPKISSAQLNDDDKTELNTNKISRNDLLNKHFNIRTTAKSYFGNSIYLVPSIGLRWYPKLGKNYFLEANAGVSKAFFTYYYYSSSIAFSADISFGIPLYKFRGNSVGSLVLDIPYIRGYRQRSTFEADIEYVLPGIHLDHRHNDFIGMLGAYPIMQRQSMPEDLPFSIHGISILVGFGYIF